MPPTIRELAKFAGVSRTTVSMALRNSPRISVAMREKIVRLAEEHGYQKDPVVSALMNQLRTTRKSRWVEKLAYLTFWNTRDEWRQNINEAAYFEGACTRAAQLGYEVEDFWAKQPGMSSARLGKILYSRGIRGVIFAPLPRHLGHVTLEWRHFACAGLGLTILKPELHRASHSYQEGMNLALHSLKNLGYRRPAFANTALFDRRTKHGWLSGFLTAQFQVPHEDRIPPYLVSGHKRDDVWDLAKFAKWLKQWKPDSIVSNTEQPLYLARKLGISVPEDLGFASLHRLNPDDPWAGIDRQPHQIGAAGVDLVVGQLQNNEFGLPACPKTVFLSGIWTEGPTVRSNQAQAVAGARAKKPSGRKQAAGRRVM